MRRLLELGEAETVTVVRRVSWIDDQRVAYGASWLPTAQVPDLAGPLCRDGSIYHALRDCYGHDPVRLWSRARLECAPGDVAARLGQDGRPLVWRLESGNAAWPGGPPLKVTRSWLRPDWFRLVFELGTPPAPPTQND